MNNYLNLILSKYKARDITHYELQITVLKNYLKEWAGKYFLTIEQAGSISKGTAIHLASDVDFMITLKNGTNEEIKDGLKGIYNNLYDFLKIKYPKFNIRKQNVSIRILLGDLEVDITPAVKWSGNTNNHSLYVSKLDTWKMTNVKIHINDVSNSGRTNEIKLLKIWRELNNIRFPSIYLEYLVINYILYGKSKSDLEGNFYFILQSLAQDKSNPLFTRVTDPANSSNILSDLLTFDEKQSIIAKAKISLQKKTWQEIIW